MKCMHCGAEVEKHTFCMYCGGRLTESHVTAKPVRAASGVMRFRQRASISESALPEVQKRKSSAKMELDSLKRISSENERIERRSQQPGGGILAPSVSSSATRPVAEPIKSGTVQKTSGKSSVKAQDSDPSLRQSRELEALLLKLNGPEDVYASEELSFSDEEDLASLDVEMESPSLVNDRSLDESFFLRDESEACVSGPMPVGSGSYARVPSGGFHLVVDSVKNAVHKGVVHAKRLAQEIKNGDVSKKKVIGAAVVGLAVVLMVGVWAVSGSDESGNAAESVAPAMPIAAQNTVAGNDDFAIIALDDGATDSLSDVNAAYDFDDDAFAIPMLEGDETADLAVGQENDKKVVGDTQAATGAKEQAFAAASEVAAKKKTERDPQKSVDNGMDNEIKFTEKRLYNKKDNVFAAKSESKSMKVARACIMREGPASRFGLVKEVPKGASIRIITTTEEDWVLEKGGIWTKGGVTKLGPGTKFADAVKGMSIPQPKSRVISSGNWRYVQYGDVYGYVGPACFK